MAIGCGPPLPPACGRKYAVWYGRSQQSFGLNPFQTLASLPKALDIWPITGRVPAARGNSALRGTRVMERLLTGMVDGAWRGDHELVSAVRRGEDGAFEKLFSRYRGPIRGYASGILADYDRAEDITQEVFIAALLRLRDTERPIVFRPWIYQIARNACIDELRRTRRSPEVSFEYDFDAGYDAVEVF